METWNMINYATLSAPRVLSGQDPGGRGGRRRLWRRRRRRISRAVVRPPKDEPAELPREAA